VENKASESARIQNFQVRVRSVAPVPIRSAHPPPNSVLVPRRLTPPTVATG
jgi:hypothetical protein